MDIAAIAQQCDGAHRDKQGWRAKCPLHQGKTDTSLHIWTEGDTLRIYCFAGCPTTDLLNHFDLKVKRKQTQPENIFNYLDENGNLLFQVCRMPGKKFFQRKPHPSRPGKWINSLEGVTPQLYHLPEIIRAVEAELPIYLVEGEKDVETLRAQGLIATTNPMGAKKWKDSYSETLRGAKIIQLYDNDKPGKEHADLVVGRLTGYVKELTRIDLPDLDDGGDVTDFLAIHTIQELQALIGRATPKVEAPHLVLEALEDIQREEITWLWEPYIPLGKLTFLEGDPGNGKTFLALAIATAGSKGYSLPDKNGNIQPPNNSPFNILYITAEDGLGDTIRPRAEDMGADLTRILAVTGWTTGVDVQMFNFQQINLLEDAIRDREVKLVIIDPIDAFLGGDIDMYRPNEVKPVMTQISIVAAKTSCAIVFIRHWTKSGIGNARYRGLGSIAFTASARSQLVVGEALDDESKRIMAQAKSNVGELGRSQVFSIQNGLFTWCGISDIDADQLAQQQPRKRQHQLRAASGWLRDILKSGPMAAQTVFDLGESAGLSEKSLRRAKTTLGILSEKAGKSWFWQLPKSYEDDMPF